MPLNQNGSLKNNTPLPDFYWSTKPNSADTWDTIQEAHANMPAQYRAKGKKFIVGPDQREYQYFGGVDLSNLFPTDPNLTTTVEAFGAKGDGVADDTAAINLALNSPYKTISFNRNYRVTAPIEPPSDKILLGNKCNIFMDEGTFLFAISLKTASNVVIDGIGISAKPGEEAIDYAIAMADSRNIVVRNCTIDNIGRVGATEAGHGIVLYSLFENAVPDDTKGNHNIKILNNRITNIKGNGNARGDCVYLKCCNNVEVAGNYTNTNRRMAIAITDFATKINIHNNILENSYLAGIDIEPNTGSSLTSDIDIADNIIYNFGSKPADSIGVQLFGIDCHGNNQKNIRIVRNLLYAMSSTAVHGISASNGSRNILIADNYIYGNGFLQCGINLTAGSGSFNVTISNNKIFDWTYAGINGYRNNHLQIAGNYLESATGSYGIYSNETDRDIINNTVVMSGQATTYGIILNQSGISKLMGNTCKVASGSAYAFTVTGSFANDAPMICNNVAVSLATEIDPADYSFYILGLPVKITNLVYENNTEFGFFAGGSTGISSNLASQSAIKRIVTSSMAPTSFVPTIVVNVAGSQMAYPDGLVVTTKGKDGLWYQINTPAQDFLNEDVPYIRYSTDDRANWGAWIPMGNHANSYAKKHPTNASLANTSFYLLGSNFHEVKSADGFPSDGILHTMKNRDGTTSQTLYNKVTTGIVNTYTRVAIANVWTVWRENAHYNEFIDTAFALTAIAPGTSQIATKTFIGAANAVFGRPITATLNISLRASNVQLRLNAYVSAANTVEVEIYNAGTAAVTAQTVTLSIRVY